MVRNSARFLAPIAIAAVAVGVYVIVHDNVATTHTSTPTHRARPAVKRTRRSPPPAAGKPASYTVRSGDTLSSISSRTGVSISRLAALNPALSPPYNLQTGQRLRLRR